MEELEQNNRWFFNYGRVLGEYGIAYKAWGLSVAVLFGYMETELFELRIHILCFYLDISVIRKGWY